MTSQPQPSVPPLLVHVEGVSKDYAHSALAFPGPADYSKSEHLALRNVSFSLSKGESIGIIGRNGSGKSTLLKLLCRQLAPTAGNVTGTNSIRALIELGTGLDVQQSGEENVKFFLRMQGLPERVLQAKTDEIHSFSELGTHFFTPVKTYSSGMFVRLAYAMHAMSSADVLIVDEALAVGDAKFQHKCFMHIHKLKAAGTSIILVSHALEQVRQLCDRVSVLEAGEIYFDGDVNLGCDRYLNLLFNNKVLPIAGEVIPAVHAVPPDDSEGVRSVPLVSHPLFYSDKDRYGSRIGMIERLSVVVDGREVSGEVQEGFKSLNISLDGSLSESLDLMVGLGIKSTEGVMLYGTNSFIDNIPLRIEAEETHYCFSIEVAVPLKAGNYFIDVGICSIDGTTGGDPLDVIPSCVALTVTSARSKINDGFMQLPVSYMKK